MRNLDSTTVVIKVCLPNLFLIPLSFSFAFLSFLTKQKEEKTPALTLKAQAYKIEERSY